MVIYDFSEAKLSINFRNYIFLKKIMLPLQTFAMRFFTSETSVLPVR